MEHLYLQVEWLTPQCEYRPTEYARLDEFWFDEAKRLDVAKQFQFARIEFIRKIWAKDKDLKDEGFTR